VTSESKMINNNQWDDSRFIENGQILKIDHERWLSAQEFERKCWEGAWLNQSDYNEWWYTQFNRYDLLENNLPENISAIEVGCGPFTNIRIIESILQWKNLKIYLSDPLIESYLGLPSCWVKENKDKVVIDKSQLENLQFGDNVFDLLICINVLDHAEDVNKCFDEMNRVLKKDGLIVLGQDLTDWTNRGNPTPKECQDVGHPQRIGNCEEKLKLYEPLLNKIVESRNPQAHYGCLCYTGKKK